MKYILLAVISFSLSTLFAQPEYNNTSYYFDSNVEHVVYNVPGVKNKTVTVQTKNVRSGKTYHYQKTFNEFAFMTELMSIKKGDSSLAEVVDYNENGKVLNHKGYKKGELRTEYKITRDKQDRRTSYSSFKRNKLKTKSDWTYKPNDKCLGNSVLYKKDGITLKKKWVYEYYGECEKKQSTLTNSKGKLLKKWTYDCKKEGEELIKKKDVKQICSWEETDDKHLIKVQQTFDEKGNVVKMISKYRSSDTSLVFYKRYNSDNELTFESVYDPDIKRQLYYKSYKNGKVKSQTNYKYDGVKVVSYTWSRKGKVKYKTQYEYGHDSQLVAMKIYKNEDKVTRITSISYQ